MKIGVQLWPQATTVKEMRTAWRAADAMGVDSLWTWDHFYPLSGDPEERHFECYTLLAAMAADTCHASVGALVTCFTYRNPQLLADMSRTIDHISDGRFVLGNGSGWFERDYTEYGYEFGDAVGRLKLLEAGLPVIKERMAKLNPQPVRGSIPLMIGGGGEKRTLRLVAEYADQYNYFGPPESYANKLRILDEWCAKVGRNPREIERTVAIYPKEVTPELFAQYKEAGAEHIILASGGPFDLGLVEQLLAWR
jgi:probable F420-dependent oxidoreductase